VAGLRGAIPGLVIVYASIRHDLGVVLAAVREVTGDTPLVGASTSGQFSNGEYLPPGPTVSVLMLGGGAYRFGTAAVTGISADTTAAGTELARRAIAAAGVRSPHGTLLVLADGMAGDMQGLLNGIFRTTGARVPVVGGAAGDDRTFTGSYVMHEGDVMRDGAVAVWIGSDRPLRVVAGHGWQPQSLPMLVTRVDKSAVEEIDGRPALDVYRESIQRDQVAPAGAATEWYTAYSFGLIEPDGSQLIRALYVENEKVFTFTPLPEYCAVQIVSATPDDLLDVSERVVDDALSGAENPAVILGFSCVARVEVLGDRAAEEAARMHKAAGQVATFGFYTYGEFARVTGVAGYHNATITAIAL
jgi:hypothetical protein